MICDNVLRLTHIQVEVGLNCKGQLLAKSPCREASGERPNVVGTRRIIDGQSSAIAENVQNNRQGSATDALCVGWPRGPATLLERMPFRGGYLASEKPGNRRECNSVSCQTTPVLH